MTNPSTTNRWRFTYYEPAVEVFRKKMIRDSSKSEKGQKFWSRLSVKDSSKFIWTAIFYRKKNEVLLPKNYSDWSTDDLQFVFENLEDEILPKALDSRHKDKGKKNITYYERTGIDLLCSLLLSDNNRTTSCALSAFKQKDFDCLKQNKNLATMSSLSRILSINFDNLKNLQLTRSEIKDLKECLEDAPDLKAKIISAKNPLIPASSLALLAMFLEDIIGDMQFNEKIQKHLQRDDEASLHHVGDLLRMFTYRARRIEQSAKAIEKIEKIQQCKNIDELSDADLLTISELGLIYDLSYLDQFFDLLDEHGLIIEGTKLSDYRSKVKKCETFILKHESHLVEKNSSYKSSIFFWNQAKINSFKNSTGSFFERIALFFQKFTHAGNFIKKGEKIYQSDLFDTGHNLQTFMIIDVIENDIYKIKLEKLLTDEGKSAARRLYGDNYLQKLDAMYDEIQEKIDTNMVGKKIFAGSTLRGLRSGASELMLFGHYRWTKNNWEEIRNDFIDQPSKFGQYTSMLCSEYVGLTIVASLKELEKQIKEQVKDQHQESINAELIRVPFSDYEDFSKLHPDRLLKILKRYDCVEKLENISSIEQVMKKPAQPKTK